MTPALIQKPKLFCEKLAFRAMDYSMLLFCYDADLMFQSFIYLFIIYFSVDACMQMSLLLPFSRQLGMH